MYNLDFSQGVEANLMRLLCKGYEVRIKPMEQQGLGILSVTAAHPPIADLANLDTKALCEKYGISATTAWRYREKEGIKQFGPEDPISFLSETDKAYLAGLIDADGFITIKKTRDTFYPGVGIAQTDFQALEWAAEKLKATVGYHTREKEGKSGYHRKQMIVRVHGIRAQILCAALLPYLKIKRGQAGIVLDFPCDTRGSGGVTDEIRKTRLVLRNRVQQLNRRVTNNEQDRD